jgi:hypothetical protein
MTLDVLVTRSIRALCLVAALVPAATAGAQFVSPGATVPVIANLPGFNDTFWRSDVNILNLAETQTTVVLQLFPEIVDGQATFPAAVSDPIAIGPGEQLQLSNVLQTRFGIVDAKGALRIFSTDGAPLVVSSRTYTPGEGGGTYGQDVLGVPVVGTGWVSGVRNDGFYRTNIGIFWGGFEPASFTITVYAASGDVAATRTVTFSEAGLQQLSLDRIGAGLLLAGWVEVVPSDTGASWYGYASTVDQITGDAVLRNLQGNFAFPTKVGAGTGAR